MNQRLLAFEATLTTVAFIAAFLVPVSDQYLRKAWHLLSRVSSARRVVVVGVGFLALGLRAAILPLMPLPEPRIHDEFSYLLAADTFAKGRLTNPTHPLWEHFETFHVNQLPTYDSMYPPAQGLVLAVGKVLGHPWIGVLLSVALMCSVLCWMLQGWLPERWATLGGLLAVIRIAVFSYWGNSYWGGAVAAIGGLLVLGALPRLLRHAHVGNVVCLCVGLFILINSRPYEGLLLSVPVGVVLIARWIKTKRLSILVISPLALAFPLLVAGALWTAYYNWRVTGSPTRIPYQINLETYHTARPFIWQSPKFDLQYRHEVMRDFYSWEVQPHLLARGSIFGFLTSVAQKFGLSWWFYLGPVMSLPLLGFTRTLRDKRMYLLRIIGAIGILGLILETWFQPHYAAPFLGVIYVGLLQSMRHLYVYRRGGKAIGRRLAMIVPIVAVVMFALAVLSLRSASIQDYSFGAWCCTRPGPTDRSQLLKDLNSSGGKHLVVVRYQSDHNPHVEWVYNEADIDKASVVFARDMGVNQNAALLEYFRDRHIWLLEADEFPLRLKPLR
jgi:hypothetical protein